MVKGTTAPDCGLTHLSLTLHSQGLELRNISARIRVAQVTGNNLAPERAKPSSVAWFLVLGWPGCSKTPGIKACSQAYGSFTYRVGFTSTTPCPIGDDTLGRVVRHQIIGCCRFQYDERFVKICGRPLACRFILSVSSKWRILRSAGNSQSPPNQLFCNGAFLHPPPLCTIAGHSCVEVVVRPAQYQ